MQLRPLELPALIRNLATKRLVWGYSASRTLGRSRKVARTCCVANSPEQRSAVLRTLDKCAVLRTSE
eukprot:1050542-Alexandrium_andersonii.AAC.1